MNHEPLKMAQGSLQLYSDNTGKLGMKTKRGPAYF